MTQWLAKKGKPAPKKPDPIYPDLIPIWNAWHDLSLSRPVGMTSGGIPWSEMSRYCDDYGIRGPNKLRWIRLLRAMDLTYLSRSFNGNARSRP